MKTKTKVILFCSLGTVLIAAAVILMVVFMGEDSKKIPSNNMPSATVKGSVTDISEGTFKVSVESVSLDDGFPSATFKKGDTVTVHVSGSPATDGFYNDIYKTDMLTVGDKVEITYYEHNSDNSKAEISSATVRWDEELYQKKVKEHLGEM